MSLNDEIKDLIKQRQAKKQLRSEDGKFVKKSVFDIAKELGLDTRDTRVLELASRQDVKEPQKAVLRLAAQMSFKVPTDADTPSHIAKDLHFASKNEQLWAEYREGAKNLSGNALIRFKQKMREKGLRELY